MCGFSFVNSFKTSQKLHVSKGKEHPKSIMAQNVRIKNNKFIYYQKRTIMKKKEKNRNSRLNKISRKTFLRNIAKFAAMKAPIQDDLTSGIHSANLRQFTLMAVKILNKNRLSCLS